MLIKLDTNVYTSKVHSFSTVSGEVEGKQLTVPDLNVSMDAMTAYRAGFSQLIGLMSYYQSLLTQDAGKLLTLRDELFYPQIGVKPCSMAGGGVSKNIWNCFRTAPEGTGQPLTCSTSGMGLRLK